AMADAEAVLSRIARHRGVEYSALALNERGMERALETELDLVNLAFPVTDEFCRRNQNTTTADAADTAVALVERGHGAGRRVSVTLAAAFGCPFEGEVDPGRVVELVARMAAAGADEVVLADTIGVGVPAQVHRLLP